MATYTDKYHLKKPDPLDFADIADLNENMDTIDEELASSSKTVLQNAPTTTPGGYPLMLGSVVGNNEVTGALNKSPILKYHPDTGYLDVSHIQKVEAREVTAPTSNDMYIAAWGPTWSATTGTGNTYGRVRIRTQTVNKSEATGTPTTYDSQMLFETYGGAGNHPLMRPNIANTGYIGNSGYRFHQGFVNNINTIQINKFIENGNSTSVVKSDLILSSQAPTFSASNTAVGHNQGRIILRTGSRSNTGVTNNSDIWISTSTDATANANHPIISPAATAKGFLGTNGFRWQNSYINYVNTNHVRSFQTTDTKAPSQTYLWLSSLAPKWITDSSQITTQGNNYGSIAFQPQVTTSSGTTYTSKAYIENHSSKNAVIFRKDSGNEGHLGTGNIRWNYSYIDTMYSGWISKYITNNGSTAPVSSNLEIKSEAPTWSSAPTTSGTNNGNIYLTTGARKSTGISNTSTVVIATNDTATATNQCVIRPLIKGAGFLGTTSIPWGGVFTNKVYSDAVEPASASSTSSIGAITKHFKNAYVDNITTSAIQSIDKQDILIKAVSSDPYTEPVVKLSCSAYGDDHWLVWGYNHDLEMASLYSDQLMTSIGTENNYWLAGFFEQLQISDYAQIAALNTNKIDGSKIMSGSGTNSLVIKNSATILESVNEASTTPQIEFQLYAQRKVSGNYTQAIVNDFVMSLNQDSSGIPMFYCLGSTAYLGTSAHYWDSGYVTQLYTQMLRPRAGTSKILVAANLNPNMNATSTSNGYTLGDSSSKWRYLYAYSGTIQTSGKENKDSIHYLTNSSSTLRKARSASTINQTSITYDDVEEFVKSINPATFCYKDGQGEDVEATEENSAPEMVQLGLIAEDVKDTKLFKYIGCESEYHIDEEKDDEGNVVKEPENGTTLGLKVLPVAITALTACKMLFEKIEELEARLQ